MVPVDHGPPAVPLSSGPVSPQPVNGGSLNQKAFWRELTTFLSSSTMLSASLETTNQGPRIPSVSRRIVAARLDNWKRFCIRKRIIHYSRSVRPPVSSVPNAYTETISVTMRPSSVEPQAKWSFGKLKQQHVSRKRRDASELTDDSKKLFLASIDTPSLGSSESLSSSEAGTDGTHELSRPTSQMDASLAAAETTDLEHKLDVVPVEDTSTQSTITPSTKSYVTSADLSPSIESGFTRNVELATTDEANWNSSASRTSAALITATSPKWNHDEPVAPSSTTTHIYPVLSSLASETKAIPVTNTLSTTTPSTSTSLFSSSSEKSIPYRKELIGAPLDQPFSEDRTMAIKNAKEIVPGMQVNTTNGLYNKNDVSKSHLEKLRRSDRRIEEVSTVSPPVKDRRYRSCHESCPRLHGRAFCWGPKAHHCQASEFFTKQIIIYFSQT
ncbi:unnamed protein product [Protopolystoma xenopodis]|uniref:Uncharacterized protein n=1 Tax=Protopolystoma xenopodis TaxID=117903 RepID=A0A448XAQ1_9PLAT|nr:unnamed protein product [Protopolystoma xenopodis]